MEFSAGHAGRDQQVIELFDSAFTASEGAEHGQSVRRLVTNLLATTPPEDVVVFCAHDGATLVGCIVASRLRYDQDERTVFVLAPVAVRTDRQGEGVGRRLLTYGLEQLRSAGVDVVVTYGDPAYYSAVGFQPITEDVARAPLPLSMPEGWLAQSLTDRQVRTIVGSCRCVPALSSPEYW